MMWSKKRKRFARYYDHLEHRFYLFRTWMERELSIRLCNAFDNAMLYGIDDNGMPKKGTWKAIFTVPDEILYGPRREDETD